MSEHVDVIIIGASTTGLSAMREAQKRPGHFNGQWRLLVDDLCRRGLHALQGAGPSVLQLVCLKHSTINLSDALISRKTAPHILAGAPSGVHRKAQALSGFEESLRLAV
jgi:hypothetical protein